VNREETGFDVHTMRGQNPKQDLRSIPGSNDPFETKIPRKERKKRYQQENRTDQSGVQGGTYTERKRCTEAAIPDRAIAGGGKGERKMLCKWKLKDRDNGNRPEIGDKSRLGEDRKTKQE